MKQDQQDTTTTQERKPWRLTWVLIVILAYIALQTAFFLFVAD